MNELEVFDFLGSFIKLLTLIFVAKIGLLSSLLSPEKVAEKLGLGWRAFSSIQLTELYSNLYLE